MTSMDLQHLRAELAALKPSQTAEVAVNVRRMLKALPPDADAESDARQRALLEAFLLGYDLRSGST